MTQQVNCLLLSLAWVLLMTCSGCKGLYIEPCSGQEPFTKVELKCRGKTILSEFLVTSQMFEHNCTGEDPDLIAYRNQCYWNTTCKMQFPVRRMVTCHKAENEDSFSSCPCFYQEAKRLLIQKAKCTKKKYVETMCEGSDVIKTSTGMIRSHEIYPWNVGESHVNRTCRKIKGLESLKKNDKLAVGIRMKELGESESLVMNTAHETYKYESGANNKFLKLDNTDVYLNITFIGGGDTANFGGFVICFKKMKKKELDDLEKSSKHVCDSVAKRDAFVKVRVGKFDVKCPKNGKSGSKKKRHAGTNPCCCDEEQCNKISDMNS